MFDRFSDREGDKRNGKIGSFNGAFSQPKSGDDVAAKPEKIPTPEPESDPTESKGQRPATSPNRHTDLKVHLHRRLLDRMNLAVIDQMKKQCE